MLIKEAFEVKGSPIKWDSKKLSKQLIEKAKSYSCSSRAITVTNDKLLKKTEKMKLSSRSKTGIFARILLLVRRQFKHRGLHIIKPGDKDWLDLKEPCKLATEFCNEFGIAIKEGYTMYLQIAMSMMAKYSIYKLKSLHEAICNRFEAKQEIERDKTPKETEEIYSHYVLRISEKVGFSQDYKAIPEKYVFFVKAKEEANKLGISYKEYIRAQFTALEWANGIPDPAQLIGTKGKERVIKYAFENNIQLRQAGPVSKVNFKKVKNAHRNNRRK